MMKRHIIWNLFIISLVGVGSWVTWGNINNQQKSATTISQTQVKPISVTYMLLIQVKNITLKGVDI